MKTLFSKILTILIVVVTLYSCSSLNELGKNNYKIIPNPLEVHGGKVKLNVKGKFPPKFIGKAVSITLTPTLKYPKGQKEYKSVTYQGEEFPGNNMSIPYETGKSVTYSNSIDYVKDMEKSELFLHIKGQEGSTVKDDFKPIKLADGVITTSLLVENDAKVALVPHGFERITTNVGHVHIHFPYNSSLVKRKELKDKDFKELKKTLKKVLEDEALSIKSIEMTSYASPEGEITLNQELTNDRNKSSSRVFARAFKRAKLNMKSYNPTLKAMGADWDGFHKILQESDIQDKDMIKRSLDENPLLPTKEKTLRSLMSTYPKLPNHIMPQLRRTKMVITYEVVGKSDEQIIEHSQTALDQLNEKEMLYAATLVEDKNEKIKIYTKGMEMFPNNYAFYNNLIVVNYSLGDLDSANKVYDAATDKGIADQMLNLGFVLKLQSAKLEDMDDLLKEFAKVTTPESTYNKGIVAIKQGDYALAIDKMKGYNTFNLALAKVLNADYEGGISVLDEGKINTAKADYLRAIASVRMGKVNEAKNYIKSASSKDASLEDKAKNDLEFKSLTPKKAAKENE